MEIIPVLFDIRSIHNVGSIFRTADAAGCGRIELVGFTPSPFDRIGKVRSDFKKVALGAEEKIKVHSSTKITATLRELKKEGFFIVALEQAKNSILYTTFHKKFPKEKKIVLLIGNEPKGIPAQVLKQVDVIIEIPMSGIKESLNVSVAFGIALYELKK
jgi:tRNA G18 (ribose-2'-O)-methylase SpoU